MKLLRYFICFASPILLSACLDKPTGLYETTSDKVFLDVIEDSEFVITENNFRIINRLHIGSAIRERGNSDFPQHEVILFCNLSIAEEMLQIEPRYINYCPYKITITEHKDKVFVGTQLLPTNTNNEQMDSMAKKINKRLRLMVTSAASDDFFIFE